MWEGERLGVSTFLTNHIKCTQGWIFYLFGFFFSSPSYRALDFWTWKITKKLYKHTSCKTPPVMQSRCWACPTPASGHSWGRLVPKSWDFSPEQSELPAPHNWDGCKLFLLFHEPFHHNSPMAGRYFFSFLFNGKHLFCVEISLKHPWAWVVQKALTKY